MLGRFLVQSSSTECGVLECDRKALIMRKLWPTSGCYAMEEKRSALAELFNMLLQSSSYFWVALYRNIIIMQGYFESKTHSIHCTCEILAVGYTKSVSRG